MIASRDTFYEQTMPEDVDIPARNGLWQLLNFRGSWAGSVASLELVRLSQVSSMEEMQSVGRKISRR
jgi:hypothetical protein